MKPTTVIVPEGAGFDLAASLSSNHLCLDITSNGQWMDGNCYDAIAKARYDRQRKMGLIDERFPRSQQTYRDWNLLSEDEKQDQDLRMAVYAAMIDRIDQNIGRILTKVRELGEEENILILFASDNGASAEVVEVGDGEIGTMTRWASLQKDWANVCNTPFRLFKNYSHEGGTCTPLIAYWPKVIRKGGEVSEWVGHFIDFMPTFRDMAGAEYASRKRGEEVLPFAGESFLPILRGQQV